MSISCFLCWVGLTDNAVSGGRRRRGWWTRCWRRTPDAISLFAAVTVAQNESGFVVNFVHG